MHLGPGLSRSLLAHLCAAVLASLQYWGLNKWQSCCEYLICSKLSSKISLISEVFSCFVCSLENLQFPVRLCFVAGLSEGNIEIVFYPQRVLSSLHVLFNVFFQLNSMNFSRHISGINALISDSRWRGFLSDKQTWEEVLNVNTGAGDWHSTLSLGTSDCVSVTQETEYSYFIHSFYCFHNKLRKTTESFLGCGNVDSHVY